MPGLGLAMLSCAGSPALPARNYGNPPPPANATNAIGTDGAASAASVEPGMLDSPESAEDESSEEAAPAWLGVELALRGPDQPGVLVRSVVPGSPAERAGILKGDVISTLDGQGVTRPSDVVSVVAAHQAGDRIAIALLRAEKERLFAATLEAQPSDEALMRKRYVGSLAPTLGALTPVRGSVSPNLNTLRGHVVIVEFWAGWCVPCRITAPLLSSWSDRYGAEGLRVLGVTTDPVVQAAEGAEHHGMTYAVFSDEDNTTTLAYRAFALPTLFLIDRRGIVRDVVVGFSTTRLKQVESALARLLAER